MNRKRIIIRRETSESRLINKAWPSFLIDKGVWILRYIPTPVWLYHCVYMPDETLFLVLHFSVFKCRSYETLLLFWYHFSVFVYRILFLVFIVTPLCVSISEETLFLVFDTRCFDIVWKTPAHVWYILFPLNTLFLVWYNFLTDPKGVYEWSV